jgi:hypothetical protein
VRRVPAILLLAVFSFSLIGPAMYASDADSNLPACCRRDGKHHCAMAANRTDSSAPALQASKCPAFPGSLGVPIQPTGGLVSVSQAVFAAVVSHPASQPQVQALYRVSFSRAGQKRGPPVFFS